MTELTNFFGPGKHLVGTLSVPAPETQRPVGFILLNAGVISRIGPHRINVKLASALAARGFASLRFDLSAQGDSLQPRAAIPFLEQAVADVRAAMDHMQRTVGVDHFIIAGLCSGAHHATSTAVADERVVGVWMYDTFHYPTAKTPVYYYTERLRREGLRAMVPWFSKLLRGRALRPVAATPESQEYWQATPPRAQYGAMLQRLVRRGTKIFVVHSGSFLDAYSYAGQFLDGFRDYLRPGDIRSDFFPEFDHTLTSVEAQQRVIRDICGWAEDVGPAQAGATRG
jgi:hypothetical protein